MNQVTISLSYLFCTRSITLLKKQVTLQSQCFTGTVHSFTFKLHKFLVHTIPLNLLTHILITLHQNNYNKTSELQLGEAWGREEKKHYFFHFIILPIPKFAKKSWQCTQLFLFCLKKGFTCTSLSVVKSGGVARSQLHQFPSFLCTTFFQASVPFSPL